MEKQGIVPGKVRGIICGPKLYEYAGWFFEFGHCGPWPLKKDGDPRKRAGRKFYNDISDFLEMNDEDQKEYRVGGGCIFF
jgi:hypothetical protein